MRQPTVLAAVAASLSIASSLAAPVRRSGDTKALSAATLNLVQQRLAEIATDTWTAGTYGEALLELEYPAWSVFSPSFSSATGFPSNVEYLVNKWSAKRPSWTKELAYVENGAAGDPPALGVPWLVAAQSNDNHDTRGELWQEASAQLQYLLDDVPRTQDGAISHRPPHEAVQLWADFVYMVPPFLAYFGAITKNSSLLAQAYTQCQLYRKYLSTDSTGSLRHIVLGDWQDNGLWSTGNGWAAAGFTRVLATMQNSQYADQFASEISDLKKWTKQLLTAAFSNLRSDGLLPNYYDLPSSFSDAAGSALLASAAYRLAVLDPKGDYASILASAATIRAAVNSGVDSSSGLLSPVVDPLAFAQQGKTSPEGQAFVLLLHSAWRDWQNQSSSSSQTGLAVEVVAK
ncbi:hypothetical protein JCM10212_000602 [Sporobolomyces blumeae]